MPIPQLSVFLDNRPGSMSEVMKSLEGGKIKILALSIADSGEFGLARIIVDEPERALAILEDAQFMLAKSRRNTEVTAVLIREQDRISEIAEILGDNRINIDYAYLSAGCTHENHVLIMRLTDAERAEKTLKENNVNVLAPSEIKQYLH